MNSPRFTLPSPGTVEGPRVRGTRGCETEREGESERKSDGGRRKREGREIIELKKRGEREREK